MTEDTNTSASSSEVPWSGVERRRKPSASEAYGDVERRRLGDRLAKTCVVQKAGIPVPA